MRLRWRGEKITDTERRREERGVRLQHRRLRVFCVTGKSQGKLDTEGQALNRLSWLPLSGSVCLRFGQFEFATTANLAELPHVIQVCSDLCKLEQNTLEWPGI